MRRLLIYKDQINKSKRRGNVPLQTFYVNTPEYERMLNMFNQEQLISPNMPKDQQIRQKDQGQIDYITAHLAKQKEMAAEEEKLKQLELQIKETKLMNQVAKQVFGDKKLGMQKSLTIVKEDKYSKLTKE